MRCQFCGEPLDPDEMSHRQQLGITTSDESGVLVEAKRFVSSGICGRCGTMTFAEYIDYEEDLSLLDYDEVQERSPPSYGD